MTIYEQRLAELAEAMPHGLKGRPKVKRRPGQRIIVRVNQQERARGCTTCTLSRCREGAPACNLTRITLAKRRAYRERQTLHAHSNAE